MSLIASRKVFPEIERKKEKEKNSVVKLAITTIYNITSWLIRSARVERTETDTTISQKRCFYIFYNMLTLNSATRSLSGV